MDELFTFIGYKKTGLHHYLRRFSKQAVSWAGKWSGNAQTAPSKR